MVPQRSGMGRGGESDTASDDRQQLSRRRILSMAGGATAGGVAISAFSGTAMANNCDPSESSHEVVFCGCSQVCWCVTECNIVSIITAEKTVHYTRDCRPEDSSRENEENEYIGEYVKKGCHEDDKILAVQVIQTQEETCDSVENGTTVYCNPHTCAEKERKRIGVECGPDGDMAREVAGGCGSPPCEHPARVQNGHNPQRGNPNPQRGKPNR